MHGLVAMELRQWVGEVAGPDAWAAVEAAVASAVGPLPAPDPAVRIPGDRVPAMLDAVGEVTGMGTDRAMEVFGRATAHDFLELHRSVVDPSWRTLDLLEHSETVMHRAVRVHDAAARPPLLRPRRRSEDVVEIFYGSPARLCSLARGLIHGYADHYGEEVRILEPQCMHRGDGVCRLDVHLVRAPAGIARGGTPLGAREG